MNPYGFPCKPYETQLRLMEGITTVLDAGSVGIFESPTGTGKTLSVLCAVSSWICAQPFRVPLSKITANNSTDCPRPSSSIPKWITTSDDHEADSERLRIHNALLDRRRARLARLKSRPINVRKKVKRNDTVDADEKTRADAGPVGDSQFDVISRVVERGFNSDSDTDAGESNPEALKVFFCSRTHSQLNQVISEFKKTSYVSELSLVSLGSRSHMCIHPDASIYHDSWAVNETCRTLREHSRCSFYDRDRISVLSDVLLDSPCSVVEGGEQGKRLESCPYFASRKSLREANIITCPYATILSESNRRSLDINLKGNIVVFDEAHNLFDAVISAYRATLHHSGLSSVLQSVCDYLSKYGSRLSAANRRHADVVQILCEKLLAFLKSASLNKSLKVSALVTVADLGSLDLFEIARFLEHSDFVQKMYAVLDSNSRNYAYDLRSFLATLLSSDDNVRVLVDASQNCLSTYLLDPRPALQTILADSHAVICVGGTMKPIQEFESILFRGLNSGRVSFVECPHVVPSDQVYATVISSGPRGPFRFTFGNRSSAPMLEDTSVLLESVSSICPGGAVVFVPSFSFLDRLVLHCRESGCLNRIVASGCPVFVEPRQSGEIQGILDKFSNHCKKELPAVLFAVAGGKLSEGINFADACGRVLVMLGLPFAPMEDPVLTSRMEFLDMHPEFKFSGKEFYEKMCMKRVNQCIGRVIRHIRDYAAILLVDERYGTPHISDDLPSWIQRSIRPNAASTTNDLNLFFQNMKTSLGDGLP
eukprot:ANDGO_04857.mRNA.1 ATP-dependent DNA helicase chl-1